MSIDSDIKQLKTILIKKAAKKGLYENFGQKEIVFLEDEWGDSQYQEAIRTFEDWCVNYTGEEPVGSFERKEEEGD